MEYTVFCLGKCGTVLAHGRIKIAAPFAKPEEGWCDRCMNGLMAKAAEAARAAMEKEGNQNG